MELAAHGMDGWKFANLDFSLQRGIAWAGSAGMELLLALCCHFGLRISLFLSLSPEFRHVMLSISLAADDGNIMLDPSIRDWVLLPIFLVMFGQGDHTTACCKEAQPRPALHSPLRFQFLIHDVLTWNCLMVRSVAAISICSNA
jgi:hypothetical protein